MQSNLLLRLLFSPCPITIFFTLFWVMPTLLATESKRPYLSDQTAITLSKLGFNKERIGKISETINQNYQTILLNLASERKRGKDQLTLPSKVLTVDLTSTKNQSASSSSASADLPASPVEIQFLANGKVIINTQIPLDDAKSKYAVKIPSKAVDASDGTIIANLNIEGSEEIIKKSLHEVMILQQVTVGNDSPIGIVAPFSSCSIITDNKSGSGRIILQQKLYSGNLSKDKYEITQPKEQFSLAKDLTEGLARIHRKGIVHRDIKPANVLTNRQSDNSWSLHLADFDLADEISQLTHITGTPGYTDPLLLLKNCQANLSSTQLYNLKQSAMAADIFGLGITFAEAFGFPNDYYNNLVAPLMEFSADTYLKCKVGRNTLTNSSCTDQYQQILKNYIQTVAALNKQIASSRKSLPESDKMELQFERLILAMIHPIPSERPTAANASIFLAQILKAQDFNFDFHLSNLESKIPELVELCSSISNR